MIKVSISVLLILLSTNNLFSSKWEKVIYDTDVINLNDICIISGKNAVAVGEYGVVRYTADGGNNWTGILLPGRPDLFGIAKKDSNTVFAVGDRGTVFISSNKGLAWNQLGKGKVPTEQCLCDIAFFDNNKGVIAGDNGTILITNDGGDNWVKVENKDERGLKSIAYINDSTIICIGDKGVVLLSTNSGNEWAPKESKTQANLKIVRAPDATHIYAVGDSLSVTISNDIGNTWKCSKLDTVKSDFVKPQIKGCLFIDSLVGIVRVDDNYSNKPIVAEISTLDGGKSWIYKDLSTIGTDKTALNPRMMELSGSNTGFSVGKNGEIYKIEPYNNFLIYYRMTRIFQMLFRKIAASGNNILAIYNDGLAIKSIFSGDRGNSWFSLPRFDSIGADRGQPELRDISYPVENTIYLSMINNKDTLYFSGGQTVYTNLFTGYILKSTDNGNSWKEIVFPNRYRVEKLIMLNKDQGIIQTATNYFYLTKDGWTTYDSVIVPGPLPFYINEVHCPEKNIYYVVISRPDKSNLVYYSSNGGLTWDTAFKAPNNLKLQFIHRDKAFSWETVFDSLENKYHDIVYYTDDRGYSWNTVMNEVTGNKYTIPSIYFNKETGIAVKGGMAGYSLAYYISSDKGKTWRRDSITGFEQSEYCLSLAYFDNETIYFTGTLGTILKYSNMPVHVWEDLYYSAREKILINPNPVHEYIYLNGVEEWQDIRIYSSAGVKVYESSFVNKIDVGCLAPGVYFLISGEYIARFVKID